MLREIRSELIPTVPTLAVELAENPLAIHHAIAHSLEVRDIDPSSIESLTLNKTERHVISGHLIEQQRKSLVDGAGDEARFTDFATTRPTRFLGRNPITFAHDLQATQKNAATAVEAFYGSDEGGNILQPLTKRYRRLGYEALVSTLMPTSLKEWLFPRPAVIPREGQSLHKALRSRALSSTIGGYFDFINARVPGGKTRRIQAAHDLTHLLTTRAGLHFSEFKITKQPLEALDLRVVQGEDGRFMARRNGKDEKRSEVYPRINPDDLQGATLKCPAHANRGAQDTNLKYLIHAAINQAVEYDYF